MRSESGRLRAVHELAKRVRKIWELKGGMLQKPVERNQVWIDLHQVEVTAEG